MKIADALLNLRPGSEWTVPNGATKVSDINFIKLDTVLTQEELDAEMAKPDPTPVEPTVNERIEATGFTPEELQAYLDSLE